MKEKQVKNSWRQKVYIKLMVRGKDVNKRKVEVGRNRKG